MAREVAAAKNDAVDGYVGDAVWIMPCSADPGNTGANLVDCDPQETTWGAPVNGVKTGTQCIYPDAPAGSFPFYAAFEDEALTQYRFGAPNSPLVTFGGPGTLTITPRVTNP